VLVQKYLAANPGLAPQVGSRLDFSPAGEAVSEVLKERLRDTVARFRTFLQSKGFNNLDDGVSVFIYSKDAPPPAALKISSEDPNSFYSENTLYIHKALSEDLSIALREFTHYALLKAVGEELFRQTAVESALADYLPATFLKSPIIGSGFAKTASRLGIRTLDNNRSYDAEATKGPGGWFPRGIVWAGTLWTCRNPEQPEAVDNLILPAWHKASVLPLDDDLAEARFGAVARRRPATPRRLFQGTDCPPPAADPEVMFVLHGNDIHPWSPARARTCRSSQIGEPAHGLFLDAIKPAGGAIALQRSNVAGEPRLRKAQSGLFK
jgi:hypothetical protein